MITQGTLDLGLRSEYQATYLIGNQLVAQVNSQNLMTETSTISIEGAIVTVTDAAGNQLDYYKSLTGTTVYPSTGSTPGYSFATVVAVSQKALSALEAESGATINGGGSAVAVSYVKFYGHTLGGTYIESNNFEFPVEVCKTTPEHANCLIDFSQGSETECNGVALLTPNCLGSSTSTSSLPIPCVPGQDSILECGQCLGSAVCQGAYANNPLPAGCVDAGTD